MKTISISTIFVVFFVFFLTLAIADDNDKTFRRIFEVSESFDDPDINEALMEAGFNSAASIANMSEKAFVRKATAAGIKKEIASKIHKKATKLIFEKKQKKITPYHSDNTGGPQKENKEKE